MKCTIHIFYAPLISNTNIWLKRGHKLHDFEGILKKNRLVKMTVHKAKTDADANWR
jgi:hypothetical protein